MKEQTVLVATLHRTTQIQVPKTHLQDEINSHKKKIQLIKTNHQQKLRNSQLQIQEQSITKPLKSDLIFKASLQKPAIPISSVPKDPKNPTVNDTDKMLYEKKFKNFLNHRQQFETKAQQRREKIMQKRKQNQLQAQNEQDEQDAYVDRQELFKDTKNENQFGNAQDMMAFYEQITFGKKNKKNVHLYHAEKIQYRFRREEFDNLLLLESQQNQNSSENELTNLGSLIKKDTLLNYLFDEPAIMMLYSINPYQLGDELADFQTATNDHLTFQEFSCFLLINREPTYFQYSKQNLEEARKIGRGIKCQPIISKWIGDQQTYDWLIQLFKNVDILGEQKTDKEVLVKKIRKEAQKKRLLDEEIIEIVNLNKLITLDRILYEIEFCTSEDNQITLQQFEDLLKHYHRLSTPEKDKVITKLILSGKYDPSYVFILGTEPLEIIKETFNSMQKFAEYFVPKQKFVQKFIKNAKFNKIRNLAVRSQTNRYVKKETIEQTLTRFLNEAQPYVDVQQVLEFFTNRGRPRKVEHQIYLANLEIQIARIEEQQRRREQKKLSQGDYSTSSDEQEFQRALKQKKIQRKKDKLASIRAANNFDEGKKFNVTVPIPFSFQTKEKGKISTRQKKLKQQLDQKRKQQQEAMKPIKPKPLPSHVKQDLYEKITKEQERQRKERLEKFRLEIQQNMYPISPHLLSKPKSKSIYEQAKSDYKFVAKPLPWYCEVNLLQRIQKQKDQRRQRILEDVINKHNDMDMPDGFKKMIQRGEQAAKQKQRQRAISKTTANDKECTFNPKITQSIPDFEMIHEHLRIDLENKKQQKQPIEVQPFSFQNRPTRSRTAVQPHQRQQFNKLKQSKQSQIHKVQEEQINIPITEKHLALMNLRKKQEEQKFRKMEEQKRASTVRKMRQQKFAPYVREVLRKSRVGDVAHSRAIIESKIKEFKKEERKRKRQYEEEMIKIYTKVFNRPLLVEGQGDHRHDQEDQQREHHQVMNHQRPEQRGGQRKHKAKKEVESFAQDYQMPHGEQQYSRRNPKQQEYDDMRRKAIEHPPRNYLMEEPNHQEDQHYDQEDYDEEYLSQNGRYTN